jgi:hypothetical protein
MVITQSQNEEQANMAATAMGPARTGAQRLITVFLI